MNELRRMAYLDAMGIDCYVSRTQLPGAAPTRRLAIVAKAPVDAACAARPDAPPVPPVQRESITGTDFGPGARGRRAAVEPHPEPPPEPPQAGELVPRFSLATMVAGDWLWLEELHGMPLATAQVQLVQSMAQALALYRRAGSDDTGAAGSAPAVRPDVSQFDWPMHNNRQLDQGEDAARAGVAAFVGRKLEEHGCRGLVLLGQPCAQRVSLPEIGVAVVSTASSAQILDNPACKRQVWRDLQPLLEIP